VTLPAALEETVRAWIADDPDPAAGAELAALLAAGDPAEAELADRFAGRLRFGTAGLRGAVAAGPRRMNRAVVRTATAALSGWLSAHVPGAAEAGVVVGRDARHGSAAFAEETALVLAGAGFRVHLLEGLSPTPMLAFAVRHLGAAAGVMITASHNPKPDNGYKLYLGDGAQIVPPVDAEIEELMGSVGPLSSVPVGDLGGPLVVRHGSEVVDAFLDALAAESPAPAGGSDLRVVYTPLHGVALPLFEGALARAGFSPAIVVQAQAEPDPEFPTLAFPNPEEPGTLDLALAEARRVSADVLVANDPDGDRLAVGVPDPSAAGGWRLLSGDQLGSLLGDYVLARSARGAARGSRVVATTIVSSTMLSRIAAAAGARYVETLTGFKWIARAADGMPESRLVFGYEEALGYSVGGVVRDKDGIGTALAFLGLAATAARTGRSVLELLDDLELRHGVHLTGQLSIRSIEPAATMRRLRAEPPAAFGGRPVLETRDLLAAGAAGGLPPADVLVYRLEGARVVVRPSGTEPKLKAYVEVVRAPDHDLAAARKAAGAELEALRGALSDLLGG
jgi:phosphomannomutase